MPAWAPTIFMADAGKTYIPSPELVTVLAATGETLFQFVCRHAELLKARESELGAYPGDGPTCEQADALVAALHPLIEDPCSTVAPDTAWNAFRAAVDAEMSWLFPERDPPGAPMTEALREVQNITGKMLEQAQPETVPELNRYADLAVAENALRRQRKLHGNSVVWRLTFMCRMALARSLWWLGGGKRR